MLDIEEFKNFMRNNSFRVSYTYKKKREFFLERGDDMIKKNKITDFNCKVISWFHSINSKGFVGYIKKKFNEYINNNHLVINNQKTFTDILLNNNIIYENDVILGTSEVLYPFYRRKLKTLSIPDDVHTENLNRYYIYCMIHNLLFNNANIYICLPKRSNLGKVNSLDNDLNYIRFTTKEMYTIAEFLKLFVRDKKINKKIKVDKIADYKGLFNVWKMYSI